MNEVAVDEPGACIPAAAIPSQVVLHIDDDPNDTELFRAAARKANLGFALHSVEDGETAVALLKQFGESHSSAPKLILLDLRMPRVTGFDLLRWIRNHAHFATTPVVVLSGSSSELEVEEALAAGANSYFEKPLAFDALVSLIRNLNETWLRASSKPALPS